MSKDKIVRRIKKALKKGGDTHTFDDMVKLLTEGRLQMFENGESVCVTEILSAPQKRYLSIFLAAGNMDELKELQPRIVQFARENGCKFIQACGRMGWEKVATDGWKKRWVVHTLDVA